MESWAEHICHHSLGFPFIQKLNGFIHSSAQDRGAGEGVKKRHSLSSESSISSLLLLLLLLSSSPPVVLPVAQLPPFSLSTLICSLRCGSSRGRPRVGSSRGRCSSCRVAGRSRSSVGSLVRGSGRGDLALRSNLLVLRVQTLSFIAVKVEPPVADEVVLVEDGSVGAEEAVLGEAALTVSCADMEGLALGLRVSIVT